MVRQTHAQGTGRHSKEEVERIGCGHLQALADFLRDKPFFFGNEPTLLVREGLLISHYYPPKQSSLKIIRPYA